MTGKNYTAAGFWANDFPMAATERDETRNRDGGRMTLRVSYDGGRTYGPVREVQVDPRNAVISGSPTKYPPCGCPRCTGRWVLRHFGLYAGPRCTWP
ncbi:hypothetical protein OG399_29280 [Streptomyces achromogenes]